MQVIRDIKDVTALLKRRAEEASTAEETAATSETTIRCPYNACDGSGVIMLDRWRCTDCRCGLEKRERLKVQQLFAHLQIPRRYQDKTLETYKPELAKGRGLEMALRYVERYDELRQADKNGLAFVGPTGTGKTHLAYGILHALRPRLRSAICGSVPDLMESMRPGKDEGVAGERMQALMTSELVILDDLGAESESSWVTERLFMILNARYNEQLPTIITSNTKLEVLDRIPGWRRITSRIGGMCHLVLCDGEDQRETKKETKRG